MIRRYNVSFNLRLLFLTFIYLCNVISVLSIEITESDEHLSPATEENDKTSDESNIFLEYIFKKYGSNGKISYEGFEHLLENLGLGRLKFEKNHSLEEHKLEEDGDFKEIHDKFQLHKHNHTRQNQTEKRRNVRSPGAAMFETNRTTDSSLTVRKLRNKQCFTIEEMLELNNLEANHNLGISPSNFLHMCPVIVYELDQKSCDYFADVTGHLKVELGNPYYAWLSAAITVIIISLVGLLGVFMVPLLQKAFFNELISFLVALAVGTLCGDSLLHLLPHAFEKRLDDDDDIIIMRAGTVFLSILVFYVIESMLCSSRNEDHGNEPMETEMTLKADTPLQKKPVAHSHSHNSTHGNSPNSRNHPHSHNKPANISAVAYMVIMGDGLHNLTDGLAIGAAFSGDIISGFTTAIAVFTHELPHELGDFAVLLQSGMTVSQAMFYNIVSSVLSFVGMTIGLFLGNYSSASQWIYAITAGVFLYIGLVNLVPEMKRPSENGKTNILIQVSGIMCGGLIMFLIALFEHDLEYLFLK